MRSSWPAERLIGWLLPVLAILAEGAWLAVVYVAVETAIAGAPPLLGPLELAVAAGAAAVAVRRGWLHPDDHPFTFFAVLVGVGVVGWLWDGQARSLVLAGDPAAAIGLHPGGWLMLVAAMRGVGRGHEIDDRALTRLVLIGVPSLALPWILGQFAGDDLRPRLRRGRLRGQPDLRRRRVHGGRPRAAPGDRSRDGRRLAHQPVLARHRARRPGDRPRHRHPRRLLLGLPVDTVARALIGPIVASSATSSSRLALVAAILSTALYEALSRLGFAFPPPLTPGRARAPPAGPRVHHRAAPGTDRDRGHRVGGDRRCSPSSSFGPGSGAGRGAACAAEPRSARSASRSARSGSRCRGSARHAARPGRPTDRRGRRLPRRARRFLDAHEPAHARREAESPRAHAARVEIAEISALQADYALARYGAPPPDRCGASPRARPLAAPARSPPRAPSIRPPPYTGGR